MSNVVITMTSDEAKLYRGMQKLIAQQKVLEGKFKATGKAGKRAGAEAQAGSERAERAAQRQTATVSRLSSTIQGLTTSYLSVSSVVHTFIAAMNEADRKAKALHETQMTVAESQMGIIRNMPSGSTTEDHQAFFKLIEEIQKRRGVGSVKKLNIAGGSLLSALGGDTDRALEALDLAAAMMPDGEGMSEFAGMIGDVMGATGKGAKQSLGLVVSVSATSRVADLEKMEVFGGVAKNAEKLFQDVDPILRSRQAGALFSMLTTESADTEGRRSATASSNLMKNLFNTVEKGNTLFEKIQIVQQDKSGRLAKEVITGVGEGRMVPALMDLFSGPNSKAAQTMRDAFGKVNADTDKVDMKIEQLRTATPELRRRHRMQRALGNVEHAQRSMESESIRAEAKEIFNQTMNSIHRVRGTDIGSFFSAGAARARFVAAPRDEKPQAAIDIIDVYLTEISNDLRNADAGRRQEQQALITALTGQKELLREILNDQRDQTNRLIEAGNGSAAQAEADFVQTGANL